MKVHELQLTSHKAPKRVGRGISAGGGKTAGRGTKGQKSRTGGNLRPGFEGGQNPLAKRLPKKRGFRPLSQVTYQPVNLDQLATLKAGKVDAAVLRAAGLIRTVNQPVKILGRGELATKLNVEVQAASVSASEAITKAGGSVTITAMPKATRKNKSSVTEKPSDLTKEA